MRVKDHNVVLVELAGKAETRLTTEGTAADGYELPALWSPDSARFVVHRRTPGTDRVVTLVESSPKDAVQPATSTYRYAKPGDPIPQPKPHLFHAATKREIPVPDALFANPWDIRGFIVVMVDGMGTNWRSKAFHDRCWRDLADGGFPDRVAWIKAAAKTRPEMDIAPGVGIFGGSAGGQSAARALLSYHDFYTVAAADCGCHDNRVDKIWWNEQWMGWPVGPWYAASANRTDAGKLEGKLLLTVGELDRNVDPSSTLQLADALIKADKDFDLIVLTGAGHGAAETPYGKRRRADFFVRHLAGVEPRRASTGPAKSTAP